MLKLIGLVVVLILLVSIVKALLWPAVIVLVIYLIYRWLRN